MDGDPLEAAYRHQKWGTPDALEQEYLMQQQQTPGIGELAWRGLKAAPGVLWSGIKGIPGQLATGAEALGEVARLPLEEAGGQPLQTQALQEFGGGAISPLTNAVQMYQKARDPLQPPVTPEEGFKTGAGLAMAFEGLRGGLRAGKPVEEAAPPDAGPTAPMGGTETPRAPAPVAAEETPIAQQGRGLDAELEDMYQRLKQNKQIRGVRPETPEQPPIPVGRPANFRPQRFPVSGFGGKSAEVEVPRLEPRTQALPTAGRAGAFEEEAVTQPSQEEPSALPQQGSFMSPLGVKRAPNIGEFEPSYNMPKGVGQLEQASAPDLQATDVAFKRGKTLGPLEAQKPSFDLERGHEPLLMDNQPIVQRAIEAITNMRKGAPLSDEEVSRVQKVMQGCLL